MRGDEDAQRGGLRRQNPEPLQVACVVRGQLRVELRLRALDEEPDHASRISRRRRRCRVTAVTRSPFARWVNDETEIEDWPVPSAEVRFELERRTPVWPEPEDD